MKERLLEYPQTLDIQASVPSIVILPDGRVAVSYLDLRNAKPGDQKLNMDLFVGIFDADLKYLLQEIRATKCSFDARQYMTVGFFGADSTAFYFNGDYADLVASGNKLVATYPIANDLGVFPPVTPTGDLVVDVLKHQDIVSFRVDPCKCKKLCKPVPLPTQPVNVQERKKSVKAKKSVETPLQKPKTIGQLRKYVRKGGKIEDLTKK